MRPKTLGIYQFVHNVSKFDYPFEESILSAIPIADQIVICECESEDDTLDRVKEIKNTFPEKISIIQHSWIKHYSELSVIGNSCIPHLKTDWHFQLQADEVIHEKDYTLIKDLVQFVDQKYTALSVKYNHFLGNYSTTWPFMYERAIRIARRGSNWWLSGDACQLEGGNREGVVEIGVTLFHYGKVKEPKKGFAKEIDFQNYYKDLGFPDPKMAQMKEKIGSEVDYVFLFKDAIEKGQIRKFIGTHPAVMGPRVQMFKSLGYEQFFSKMEEGLDVSLVNNTH